MDTYKTIKRMETAGIPENYAEVITAVISESRRHSDIATKGDLKEMRYEIHYEMKCLEQRMTIKAGVLGVAIFIISMINNRF
ncbi:hypothetical protein [Polynucleobacter sp. 30F-ANTBAC]|uniref:hypothetical protein n=1 Tax=Polynucleobacter sp. 30F-ANTBAC TaxID=2689095 RepID=UPI001C0E0490|nr:hypothetical protein [Polynucleobacter sp. 30F-ANTBAC]